MNFLLHVKIREWTYIFALCLDPRHKFCDELHLPGAEGEARGGASGGVYPLWLPRLLRLDHFPPPPLPRYFLLVRYQQ